MSERYGHKTLIDGTHAPLSSEEADAIWKAIEAAIARRAEQMPGVQEALHAMCDASARMNELGWWQGGGLKVKAGDECAVAESGSTGIWRGRVNEDGADVCYADSVSERRRVWLKPLSALTDAEREHLEHCERQEAEAYGHELDRLAALHQ